MNLFSRKKKNKKIGLALGSGSARGLAHIGVIKVLVENKIPIDFIAGTSIGALVGGMYAASKNIASVEDFALSTNKDKFFSLMYDPSVIGGLVGGKKIEDYIRSYLDNLEFNQLKIPFHAVATDLATGNPVVMHRGDVSDAIRASMSVPLIFEPVKRNGKILVDGGVSCPVPVEMVKKMGADIIIGVNLDTICITEDDCDHNLNMKLVMECASNIMRYHLAQSCIKGADLVVEPKFDKSNLAVLFGVDQFYSQPKETIKRGEDAMLNKIDELKKLIY